MAEEQSQINRATKGNKIFLSLMISLYLFFIGGWIVSDFFPNDLFHHTLKDFVVLTGMDQKWSLFSPIIRDINFHSTSVVTFADGTTTVYEWPRMDRLSLFERMQKEKTRKMMVDSLPWDKDQSLHYGLAKYVAKAFSSPGHEVERVTFFTHWISIPDPKKDFVEDRYQLPEHTEIFKWFSHRIRKEEL